MGAPGAVISPESTPHLKCRLNPPFFMEEYDPTAPWNREFMELMRRIARALERLSGDEE